jgi:hypothetical protein
MCRTAPRRRVRAIPRVEASKHIREAPERTEAAKSVHTGAVPAEPTTRPAASSWSATSHQPPGVSTSARTGPALAPRAPACRGGQPPSPSPRTEPGAMKSRAPMRHSGVRPATVGDFGARRLGVASLSKDSEYGRWTQSSPGCPPWYGAGAGCRARVPGMRPSEPLHGAEVSAGHHASVPVRRPPSDRPTKASRPNSAPKPRAPLGLAGVS